MEFGNVYEVFELSLAYHIQVQMMFVTMMSDLIQLCLTLAEM